jgi:hypothetical protein
MIIVSKRSSSTAPFECLSTMLRKSVKSPECKTHDQEEIDDPTAAADLGGS